MWWLCCWRTCFACAFWACECSFAAMIRSSTGCLAAIAQKIARGQADRLCFRFLAKTQHCPVEAAQNCSNSTFSSTAVTALQVARFDFFLSFSGLADVAVQAFGHVSSESADVPGVGLLRFCRLIRLVRVVKVFRLRLRGISP